MIEICAWSAVLLWAIKRVLGYRAGSFFGILPKTDPNVALGIFIALNALSVIFSGNFGLSIRAFFGKELKFLAIYFIMAEVINSKKRLKMILTAVISSVALIAVDAAAQYVTGTDFIRGYMSARLTVSFQSANSFSGWLVMMIPIILGLFLADKTTGKPSKALLFGSAMLLTAFLLATYTRAAWLGFIVGMLLIASRCSAKLNSKFMMILPLVSGLLVGLLFLSQPVQTGIKSLYRNDFITGETLNQRLKSMLDAGEGTSTQVRLKLWEEALRMIRDHPLAGCGLNTYSTVVKDYKSFDLGGTYPHNSYLQMAAETGLLSLGAFFWVLFRFFKTGLEYFNLKKDYLALGLLSGVLAFLVQAFFDTHLYSLQLVVLFWFMLGLTMSVIKLGLMAGGRPETGKI